jgi:predicted HicB family RNase H-like nuclease
VPTIKFTLRFTPRASRYINWKSKQKKISKADYLRKTLDEQILADEEYQGFLRKPKEE